MKQNKDKWIGIFSVVLLVITAIIFSLVLYVHNNFPDQSINQMMFYLLNGAGGTAGNVFTTAIVHMLLPFSFCLLILLIPFFRFKQKDRNVKIRVRKKEYKIDIFPLKKLKLFYSFLVFLISLIWVYNILGVDQYVNGLDDYSTFMDENYVSAKNVPLTFPEKKRNLIILYLESAENTLMDKKSGGGWDYNVIPELTRLAENHINFSQNDGVGGALSVPGTQWTSAALVSTTSGLPLKIPVDGYTFTSYHDLIPGAVTLGDVLRSEGYNLQAMFGSDADFGARRTYYEEHGDYEIFDVNTAIEEGKMTEDDKVWWGFDDSHLFMWAKEEITSLADKGEPFSFTFLTANTHFPDGYMEKGAYEKFDDQYENVFAYSSKQVDEFVNWFKEQDFYENTTLVILGDHLSMQGGDFFSSNISDDYKRSIYNTFINSAVEPAQSKNRTFTSLDLFPTMLSSIGVKIEGNRLGLGTNLFSETQTLPEKYGLTKVEEELQRNSKFYREVILQVENDD